MVTATEEVAKPPAVGPVDPLMESMALVTRAVVLPVLVAGTVR